ncbi:hypothetical protein NESM_000462000 [Novymonas esmeraldas]|uniref:Uncharacterized protein n=1 Tax=Novymonas esmeraldas TaxID=1808958 RepID=A0AAW0ENU1_9TRYP
MSAGVSVPATRRNTSIFSQRSRGSTPPVPPVDESMVRQRLSVNLPDSFRYLSNTLPIGGSGSRRTRGHRPRSHSSSTRSSSSRSSDGGGRDTAAAGTQPRDRRSDTRSRPPHAPRRRASSTATTSSSSSRSSSSSASDRCAAEREDYAFYARLVRLGRGGSACGEAAVAQCCDTVRGTLRALEQAQVHTQCADSDAGFFWLDLHGVPPPLPGSSAWQQQPRRWRRRQRARDDGGSDAPLSALWAALGLRAAAAGTLAAACEQRQARPRPDRASLDDVYEEELVDLSCPDDRVLHVEPLQQQQQPREEREAGAAAAGAAAAGSTHYVVLELATLLAPVRAAAAAASEAAWEGALLSRATSATHANEPLNDVIWTDDFERGTPATVPAEARAKRAAAETLSATGSLRATQSSLHSAEVTTTPLIASTYVVCFPTGCVTWCPASTLGLASADRRRQRSAEAAERRSQQRRSPLVSDGDGTVEGDVFNELDVEDDDCEMQCVQSWNKLQASVLHRIRHVMEKENDHPCGSPTLCGQRGRGSTAHSPAICTSGFVSLLLSAVCYAYVPRTSAVLGEVDAIDSMMPLLRLNKESDQADALRRVLLLRRRLSLHRRLLNQKIRLLEALDRPTIHTLVRFIRTLKLPSWALRGAAHHTSPALYPFPSRGVASAGGPASHDAGSPHGCAQLVHFISAPIEVSPDRHGHMRCGEAADDVSPLTQKDEDGTSDCTETDRGVKAGWAATHRRMHVAAPPSLRSIHRGVSHVLCNLEAGRIVLGNTTLIYSSTVNSSNSNSKQSSQSFALLCQYMVLVVLPLGNVASHWGMMCPVPFHNVPNTRPFWGLVGVMALIGLLGFIGPMYAYKAGKMHLIT